MTIPVSLKTLILSDLIALLLKSTNRLSLYGTTNEIIMRHKSSKS